MCLCVPFQTLPGAVHIALDGWTAPNTFSFLGIVLLYMDPSASYSEEESGTKKTPMKSLVLDFVKLSKAHTGEYLADKLAECLKRFEIDLKVRTTTPSIN